MKTDNTDIGFLKKFEFLKKFDYFPKLNETVEVRKTAQGGVIATVVISIIAILCLAEIYTFLLGDPIVEAYIQKSDINEKIRVNLNISVYDVPCEALSLDYQDITGTHFEDLQHTIYKLDIDSRGYAMDGAKLELVKKFENKNFYPSHPLWEKILGGSTSEDSCYGAELYVGQKCKTCEEVHAAYRARNWPLPMPGVIKQCGYGKITRRLSQETFFNESEKAFQVKDMIRETSRFYLENSLFSLDELKNNTIFSFDVMRDSCEAPQKAYVEFSYIDSATNTTKQVITKPLFMKSTQCKTYFPLRIASVNETDVVLESKLLEEGSMSIQLRDDDLFSFKIVGEKSSAQQGDPTAVFKRNLFGKVKGRMLAAEFYGFDDNRPTLVSHQEIEYFKKIIGRGCQVVGTMYIKKVPGNFHISTHHNGKGLMFTDAELTARHKIHLLEFTKEEGAITLGKYVKTSNYLDGASAIPAVGHDVQYYLKIIGSSYSHNLWGETSFFEYVAHLDIVPKEKNVVLLEFKYEFDPVSMKYSNNRKSLAGALVSFLAIIGGIFATSTLIDRIAGK